MNNMKEYLKSLIKSGTGDSSKSFSLVLSAIIGALIGLCISFILIFDVVSDGVVNTDLSELGVFLMAVGVFMVGGGFSKTMTEKFWKPDKNMKPSDDEEKEY